MSVRSRVPLREDDECAAAIVLRRVPERVRGVVFRIAGMDGAGEGQVVVAELEIGGGAVAEKAVGIGQSRGDEVAYGGRAISVRVGGEGREADATEPVGAPVEGARYAVGIARRELTLPSVHPSSVESRH